MDEDWDLLQSLFPAAWEELGRKTGAITRLRGFSSVSNVLRTLLRQSESWLRQLCQQLWKDNGVDLSPAIAGYPVRVVDGTVVKEPGKTGTQFFH